MRIICFLLIVFSTTIANAQNATILAPQKAPAAANPAPAAAAPAQATPPNGNSRRSAAVNKVRGKTAPATQQAKGADPSPVTYSTTSSAVEAVPEEPATTVTVNGKERYRDVRKGKGQVHFGVFTPVNELYFVQFGVFCNDAPVTHAPDVEGVYLVWHAESTCPGGTKGAAYIVKGFPTEEEAKSEVKTLKSQGIDCWYNPALSGVKVEIIGVR
jgi:hypothetical protein